MLSQVTSPMDLATLLSRVDARQIPTVKAFLDTAALIPAGEQQFWGSDPEGIREVSDLIDPCCRGRVPAACHHESCSYAGPEVKERRSCNGMLSL